MNEYDDAHRRRASPPPSPPGGESSAASSVRYRRPPSPSPPPPSQKQPKPSDPLSPQQKRLTTTSMTTPQRGCRSLLPPDRYNVLIEFAHKHLDFHVAELESVLGMHGIDLIGVDGGGGGAVGGRSDSSCACEVVPLPNDGSERRPVGRRASGKERRSDGNEIAATAEGDGGERRNGARGGGEGSSSGDGKAPRRGGGGDRNGAAAGPSMRRRGRSSRRPFLVLSFPPSAIGTKFLVDDPREGEGRRDDGKGSEPPDRGGAPSSSDSESDEEASRSGGKGKKPGRARRTGSGSGPLPPTLSSILYRCTLIRSAAELWGMGPTIESCASSVRSMMPPSDGQTDDADDDASITGTTALIRRRLRPPSSAPESWKVTVHTLGSKYDRHEQNAMRLQFSFLDFPGPVKMKCPTNEYILIRESELDVTGNPLYPRHGLGKVLIPENDALPPLAAYFGRVLGGPRTLKDRGGVETYSLKKRPYLGPTSMDAELSLVMTNLGRVKRGSHVFDPFAGTGSILLACALRGAHCFGTDIDVRVLRGRNPNENVFANFRLFGLPRPELVRSDNAIYRRHYRSEGHPLYDAIVCDPPYGIRAGARKSGSKRDDPRPVDEDRRHDHIAQTKPYPVSDVMADLLDVAAMTLVMGGRLVYVIPSMTDFDIDVDLPRHECLRIVHVCYQPLSTELGRRVVAMEKVSEYDESKREEYLSKVWVNGPASAEKCANVRERLIEAAKKKPGYEEKAAMRKQKRWAMREAKKRAKREAVVAAANAMTASEPG